MKRFLSYLLLVAAAWLPLVVTAQGVKTLAGRATYYGDDHDSPAGAKEKALQMARIDALAREYGTVLSQISTQRDEIANGDENSFFSSLSVSEVKGEWISDVGEPTYKMELDADGHYVVECSVKIKARALSNKAADFRATVMRNGLTDRHADTQFRSGDAMYLKFYAPVDGYIAVYLVCGNDVMTLLPYLSSSSGKCRVSHNRDYTFFSARGADPSFGTPDEYLLQTDRHRERNMLYVLFSPNEFSKALDRGTDDTTPRSQTYNEFTKWLVHLRKADEEMGMKVIPIDITQ